MATRVGDAPARTRLVTRRADVQDLYTKVLHCVARHEIQVAAGICGYVRHANRRPIRGDFGNRKDGQATRRLTSDPDPASVVPGAPIDVSPEAGR
jgi:hypothetical protein